MRALYDRDFYAWSQKTAQALEEGRFSDADVPRVAEEIRDLGVSQQTGLADRLRVLIKHLLKCQYQPEKHTKSWDHTINEQRARLAFLLERNPSLKPMIPEIMPRAYHYAIRGAAGETGLPLKTFPKECPFTQRELLTFSVGKHAQR